MAYRWTAGGRVLHSPWASREKTEAFIRTELMGAFEIIMQEEEF